MKIIRKFINAVLPAKAGIYPLHAKMNSPFRRKGGWKKIAVLVVLVNINCAYADSALSQCSQILALSHDDFEAQISNPNQAQTISQTLDICAKQNLCSQLSGINNCSAKLANRVFDSNYQAYLSTVANQNANSTNNNMNTIAAPISNTNTAPTNNSNSITPLANPNTTAPKQSINWF